MKKIVVYAPTSGVVKSISQLKDGVFSEKMLGEGFYIEPTGKDFYSPLEEGTLKMIFNTKHAYYFEHPSGTTLLMHIGLDTVSLEGKPFKVAAKEGEVLSLDKKITSVDFDILKQNQISKATPIVIDSNQFPGVTFKIFEEGKKVKRGEAIGEFIFEENQNKEKESKKSNLIEGLDFLEDKDIFQKNAELIYNLVGTNSNYNSVFNCMTRLRFEIEDKGKVDTDRIKKIPMVKGIAWQGKQLQIVIGGEVPKLKDAISNFAKGLNKTELLEKGKGPKISKGKKFLSGMAAIMIPAIPMLMAAGILMGIKAILVLTGAMQDIGVGVGKVAFAEANIGSAIFFVVSEVTLKFLGIFIGYNTAKYLGANVMMQLMISLAIANPMIPDGFSWVFQIGKIGDLNIAYKVQAYTNSILPHIASAFALFYLDKWVQKWMPASVDVIFRPFVVFTTVVLSVFFVLGPVLFFVETILTIVIQWIGKIPGGFGVAVYAAAWQPLVLTGLHVSAIVPLSIARGQGIPSPLMAGTAIAIFGQIGAAVAVAMRTKNSSLKQTAFGTIPGALVGVSEPAIYGVNLPKGRPFIAAVIASGIAGLFSGMMGVESRLPGGMGLFSIPSYISDPVTNQTINGAIINSANNLFTGAPLTLVMNVVWYSVAMVIAIALGLGLTLFMYNERVDEKKQINLLIKKLVGLLSKNSDGDKNTISNKYKADFEKIQKHISEEDYIKIKNLEKEIIKLTNLNVKFDNRVKKIEARKSLIRNKILKLLEADNNKNEIKIIKLRDEYKSIQNDKVLESLIIQVSEQKVNIEKDVKWLSELQNEFMIKVNDLLEKIVNDNPDVKEIKNLENNFFNAAHSLDINYEMENAKEITFNKKLLIKK